MSYEIDIPQQVRKDVKMVMARNYLKRIKWITADMRYIMTVYFRYIKRLNPGETVEGCVDRDISCAECRSSAVGRVRMEMLKWQDE